MSKQILLDTEARNKISAGIDIVANSVKRTLGPAGGNAILENQFGLVVSNDGWTIAKDLDLEDKFENLGAKLIRQVASQTDKNAKGGRTTAVTIAQELIKEGRKYIESGMNAIKIRQGMELALKDALKELKKSAKKITTNEEIIQVATISSESRETGELVAKVLKSIGKDGVVNVEGDATETHYEVVKGFSFDKGYVSPYFVNNDRQEAVLNNPVVLISEKKLSSGQEAVEFLNKIHASGETSVLIIAEDVTDQALATFVINRLKGGFNIVCVKAPEWGDWRKKVMQDIALLTGTEVLSEETASKLGKIEVKTLGRIGKAVVTSSKTTLIGAKGDVSGRVLSLKYELSKEKDIVEKERLEQRIGKLGAGVAIIHVGAPSEAEVIYKRQKTEDGVNDAKSALEEGVVAGGGVALAKLKLTGKNKDRDIQAGYEIVQSALSVQLRQIVDNTGESGLVVLAEVLKGGGYDAKENCYVPDMFKAGIIDSHKVTRMVLENAVSVAAIALTVVVAISEKEKVMVDAQGNKLQ